MSSTSRRRNSSNGSPVLDKLVAAIRKSGLTIYDDITQRPDLFIPTPELAALLERDLAGLDLDFPIRTRSKELKSAVCKALGYPVPKTFKKTKPRFPGQNFDTYVQKANNLQIWNEPVSATRRYVLIRLDAKSRVKAVRVVMGDVIAALDSTGTFTQKFQAAAQTDVAGSVLVSSADTTQLAKQLSALRALPIAELFKRLSALVGTSFPNPGLDQERNRGAVLHELVQKALGYDAFSDTGRFPDVPSQLLELKLQTARTIDLGLISPDSLEPLECQPSVAHCDVRYGVFYADVSGPNVVVRALVLTTGSDFFTYFRKFGGLAVNKKLQIPLPCSIFN